MMRRDDWLDSQQMLLYSGVNFPMRKQAALWSFVALAVCFALVFPMMLHGYGTSSLLLPFAAFAFALAVYFGHIRSTWFSSLTWLLNGIVAAFCIFGVLLTGFSFMSQHPIRFAAFLVLLSSALLNSIILYPKSPRKSRERID
jgi:hypothetical protein